MKRIDFLSWNKIINDPSGYTDISKQENQNDSGMIHSINQNFLNISDATKCDESFITSGNNDYNEIMKLIYPVGTYVYVDTDDDDFNPTGEGTEWRKLPDSCLLIVADDDNTVLRNPECKDDGDKEVTLLPANSAKTSLKLTSGTISHSHYVDNTARTPSKNGSSYVYPWKFTAHRYLGSDEVGRGNILLVPSSGATGTKSGVHSDYRTYTAPEYVKDGNPIIDEANNIGQKTFSHTHPLTELTEASGEPHNNMMPYIAVNIWHRTL